MSIAEAIAEAARSLAIDSDSPRLDAELLLGKILGFSRAGLIARSNQPVSDESLKRFAGLIEKRRRGTPVAYLTGTREFWSLALNVTPAVLVPRPETEILVDLALQRLPKDKPASVLDLGTGSGAIALAIAAERPFSEVTGIDISEAALSVARQNARDLELARIDWRLGSWFSPVSGQVFDMIVSNPPYIAATDPALEKLTAEPTIALCNGPTGLEALAAIAAGAAAHLRPSGWLLLEHGSTQGPEVAHLLQAHGFASVRSHPDFSGKLRVTLGTLHSPP